MNRYESTVSGGPDGQSDTKVGRLKWWLAAIFSLWNPGLGHFYCGRYLRALLFFVAFIVSFHIAFAILIFWDQAPLNIVAPLLILIAVWVFVIRDAILAARKANEAGAAPWYRRWYACIGIGIVLGLLTSSVLPITGKYKSFDVPTGNMENAIMPGEWIMADLGAYDEASPKLNDVIIFLWPGDRTTNYMKRCVAVPGDTVQMREGLLYVNGTKETEPSTVKHKIPVHPAIREPFGPFIVPEGNYFVLGDNRDDSYDSRFWGTVPHELLLGKAIVVYYSPDLTRVGLTIR
jgi:signal peptidase I